MVNRLQNVQKRVTFLSKMDTGVRNLLGDPSLFHLPVFFPPPPIYSFQNCVKSLEKFYVVVNRKMSFAFFGFLSCCRVEICMQIFDDALVQFPTFRLSRPDNRRIQYTFKPVRSVRTKRLKNLKINNYKIYRSIDV